MSSRKKEIESLRARISKLEQLEEREKQEKLALEETQEQILKLLEDANLTFETFIRFNYKKVRTIVTKIDKEQPSTDQGVKKAVKKKSVTKKRKKDVKTKTTVKIPAGKYTNIPSNPETIFEVKEKGPRPKAVKSYAEEVGLEMFMEQCRISS